MWRSINAKKSKAKSIWGINHNIFFSTGEREDCIKMLRETAYSIEQKKEI